MLLKRWEPIAGMRRLDGDFDRMFRHAFRPYHLRPIFRNGHSPVEVDVYQDADSLKVRAAIPGMKPEDVDVSITDHTLTIKGETKSEQEVKEAEYLHREHYAGAFQRTVNLPDYVDTEKADASYENGVLTVTLPKREESKPKALKVEVKSLEGAKSG